MALTILRLRSANHKFPVETGRWSGIEYNDRLCTVCNTNEIGCEIHYILKCPFFNTQREQLIQTRYYEHANEFTFKTLMTTEIKSELINLSKFASVLINKFR